MWCHFGALPTSYLLQLGKALKTIYYQFIWWSAHENTPQFHPIQNYIAYQETWNHRMVFDWKTYCRSKRAPQKKYINPSHSCCVYSSCNFSLEEYKHCWSKIINNQDQNPGKTHLPAKTSTQLAALIKELTCQATWHLLVEPTNQRASFKE